VCDEFDRNYAHIKVPNEQEETLSNDSHGSDVVRKTHLFFLFKSKLLTQESMSSKNIFDNPPTFAPLRGSALTDEIQLYLTTDCENVKNPIQWWYEKRKAYPRLHRMALDFLSIPGLLSHPSSGPSHSSNSLATSVDVERLFSRGQPVLSHTRSRLSVASTRALLCLGSWSLMELGMRMCWL
jgi:hypothetical protein